MTNDLLLRIITAITYVTVLETTPVKILLIYA